MQYKHPTIEVQTPAPGHYVIRGHNPKSTFVDGVGHVVPLSECYISPEVPSDALLAILQERGDLPKSEEGGDAPKAQRRARKTAEQTTEEVANA